MRSLRDRMIESARLRSGMISGAGWDANSASVRNLLHYIALRETDLRPLQKRLVSNGISSLGRCEPWVLGSVTAALRASEALLGRDRGSGCASGEAVLSLSEGRALLDRRTDALFGCKPADRAVRIMVTMPDAAAEDAGFIAGCVRAGMDALRINTAAGNPETWNAMVTNLHAAEAAEGRRCRVFADLAGPKIRVTRIERKGKPRDRVRLTTGDPIRIVFDTEAARTEAIDERAARLYAEPRAIGAALEAGHPVWFDDGKVDARVESVGAGVAEAVVTFAKPGGQRLRVGKGMNLPETGFVAPALTDADRDAMRALWGGADSFSLSFVRTPGDIADFFDAARALQAELGGDLPGLVVKIETREGFERLPELLLELLGWEVGGVMLARGDLAVECGFERMAEIQEELLGFCEAAHTPVIWATEVLSTLAKRGRPTRAEITDAAMAQRAECVMLNKGPEVLSALAMLADILKRMQNHQRKKMAVFRPLSIALLPEGAGA